MNTTASPSTHPRDKLGAFALAMHNGPFAIWQLCVSPFCLSLLATSQNPLHLYLWIYLTACNLQNQEQEVPRGLEGWGWGGTTIHSGNSRTQADSTGAVVWMYVLTRSDSKAYTALPTRNQIPELPCTRHKSDMRHSWPFDSLKCSSKKK